MLELALRLALHRFGEPRSRSGVGPRSCNVSLARPQETNCPAAGQLRAVAGCSCIPTSATSFAFARAKLDSSPPRTRRTSATSSSAGNAAGEPPKRPDFSRFQPSSTTTRTHLNSRLRPHATHRCHQRPSAPPVRWRFHRPPESDPQEPRSLPRRPHDMGCFSLKRGRKTSVTPLRNASRSTSALAPAAYGRSLRSYETISSPGSSKASTSRGHTPAR